MATKRKIEVFGAGCAACNDTVALVKATACPSCDVSVLDMNDAKVAAKQKEIEGQVAAKQLTSEEAKEELQKAKDDADKQIDKAEAEADEKVAKVEAETEKRGEKNRFLPVNEDDERVARKLYDKFQPEIKKNSTKKWGILGLLGVNKQLESIDEDD